MRGSIILTGSPTGLNGEGRDFTAYSASKAGIHGLARTVAAAYADRGIRVNTVVPGYTETSLASGDEPLDGQPGNPGLAWWQPRDGSYMPTPLVADKLLYTCNDNGRLAVRDAMTGELIYRQRIGKGGGTYSASAVAAGGQRTHVEAVRGHDGQIRPVLAGQTGHRAFTRPAAEQGVEGVVGAGAEDHVVAAEAGQHGYGGATRIEDGRGGLGGYVPADLSFVTGVLRGCVDDGEALP